MIKEVAKIRNRGDITIPRSIRKQLNLREGEHLLLMTENEHIILKKLIL